ncbi:MAG: PTS sugar transporter subunit IIA [Deltaproteobacteria bacterium]|nr:PTS sugar transporter subunit IIA [Deltaproteobacteria bacterium]
MENQELTSLFEENLFVPNLRARSKEGALNELAELLATKGKIKDKEILLEMLRQRESLGSTGIGKGIAIPHGRSLAAPKLVIVFGKSNAGIHFDAIDGDPVHLFFMIIAPFQDGQNMYLVILGKLAELLRKKKIRDELLKVKTFEKFTNIIQGGL